MKITMTKTWVAIVLLLGLIAGLLYLMNKGPEMAGEAMDDSGKSFTERIQEMAPKGESVKGEDTGKRVASNAWTSYTDPEDGFSFKIPPGWELQTRRVDQAQSRRDYKIYSLTKELNSEFDLRVKITTGIEADDTICPIPNDGSANDIILRKTMRIFDKEYYLMYAGYPDMGTAWHAYLTDFYDGECNYGAIMPLPGVRGQFNVEVNGRRRDPDALDDWSPLLGIKANDNDYIEAEEIIGSLSYK